LSAMRSTILAYVIALAGLVMRPAGPDRRPLLSQSRCTYAVPISDINLLNY
jgi:hypothetical protein